jgi:hypothetical protein
MPAEVPIIKPAGPAAAPKLAGPVGGIVAPVVEDEEAPSFWTAESLKGWASSIALHAVFLIVMACWYFAPKLNAPKEFSTRLAGSDMGVEEGLTDTGGLNSTLTMPEAPTEAPPDPVMSAVTPLDVASLQPKVDLSGAAKATAEGGFKNDNPGAGSGDGFGLAKFGEGGERIHGVEVKVGDPQFTLIWDNDVDLDLHVIEPGGKEIYWEDPKGAKGLGGELDVDNTKGFGPENIYWLKDDETGSGKVKGPGPPGEYKWFVVYWGGFGGIPKLTHWKVRIKHEGQVTVVAGKFKALNERSKVHTLVVKPSTPDLTVPR